MRNSRIVRHTLCALLLASVLCSCVLSVTQAPSAYRQLETAKLLLTHRAVDPAVMNRLLLTSGPELSPATAAPQPPTLDDQRTLANFLYGDGASFGTLRVVSAWTSLVAAIAIAFVVFDDRRRRVASPHS